MRRREQDASTYNKGVKSVVYTIGDMVMLFQKDTGKLQPRRRGPIRISGFG
jgi:hypothetical protein